MADKILDHRPLPPPRPKTGSLVRHCPLQPRIWWDFAFLPVKREPSGKVIQSFGSPGMKRDLCMACELIAVHSGTASENYVFPGTFNSGTWVRGCQMTGSRFPRAVHTFLGRPMHQNAAGARGPHGDKQKSSFTLSSPNSLWCQNLAVPKYRCRIVDAETSVPQPCGEPS